jgi:hypothetical protein
MKRISEFESGRMDMKEMAALYGGETTTGSFTTPSQLNGCIDRDQTTYKDGYAMGNFYCYDWKIEQIFIKCPDEFSVVTGSTFPVGNLTINTDVIRASHCDLNLFSVV